MDGKEAAFSPCEAFFIVPSVNTSDTLRDTQDTREQIEKKPFHFYAREVKSLPSYIPTFPFAFVLVAGWLRPRRIGKTYPVSSVDVSRHSHPSPIHPSPAPRSFPLPPPFPQPIFSPLAFPRFFAVLSFFDRLSLEFSGGKVPFSRKKGGKELSLSP